MTVIADRRHTARLATVAITIVAGLYPVTQSAAQEQTAKTTIPYECVFPQGEETVTVEVSATFPSEGAVGRAIQPDDVSLDATLPVEVLAALIPPDSTSVSSTAALSVQVVQGSETAVADWAGLTAEPTELPAEGDVTLRHSGQVPTVTLGSPGQVRFVAGDLSLALQLTQESGAVEQPAEPLECTPGSDEETTLAVVDIPGEASPSPSDPSTIDPGDKPGQGDEPGQEEEGARRPSRAEDERPEPCPETRPNEVWDESYFPAPPPGTEIRDSPVGGVYNCAYTLGFSNSSKLDGSIMLNDPARLKPSQILFSRQFSIKLPGQDQGGAQQHHKVRVVVPDSRPTLLTFGFMPVTATVEFAPADATAYTVMVPFPNGPTTNKIQFFQSLRLRNVTVNGTPLDVGPNCRTTKPMMVELTGYNAADGNPPEYLSLAGGTLRNDIRAGGTYIPPFTGCGGNGEDLDRLLTASIHGPGNYIELIQGAQCLAAAGPQICDATKPPYRPSFPKHGE